MSGHRCIVACETPWSVRQWVEAKGGYQLVAEEWGVGETQVSNCVSRNAIPKKRHLEIWREAQANGWPFDPESPGPDLKPSRGDRVQATEEVAA